MCESGRQSRRRCADLPLSMPAGRWSPVAIEGRWRKFRLILIAAGGIALILAAGVPLLVAATPRATLDDVAEGLTCQCGCGLTIANCNHPNCSFSVPAKEQI